MISPALSKCSHVTTPIRELEFQWDDDDDNDYSTRQRRQPQQQLKTSRYFVINNKKNPQDDNERSCCAICLENSKRMTTLSNCTHSFCYTCIWKWSEVSTLCPLCKQEFQYLQTPLGRKYQTKRRKVFLTVNEENEDLDGFIVSENDDLSEHYSSSEEDNHIVFMESPARVRRRLVPASPDDE